jgi:hypothetical protein
MNSLKNLSICAKKYRGLKLRMFISLMNLKLMMSTGVCDLMIFLMNNFTHYLSMVFRSSVLMIYHPPGSYLKALEIENVDLKIKKALRDKQGFSIFHF